tara:strand:+ start:3678 stop:6761 length:3084 start_codon:yes stop_codon:yes gene_type:complete
MAYRVGLDKIDVSDDIVLDADGDNITFKAGSDDALGLDFSQSGGGNWSFGPTTSNKDLLFKVNVGGAATDAMILKGSNGNFGIGVSDPDQKLEVAGAIHVSGEVSSPTAPSDGDGGILYVKSDGKPYWVSSEVSETDLTATGSGGADVSSSNTFTAGQAISKDQDSEFVALVLKNESDANDTTGLVSLRFDLEDTGGTAVDSAKIAVKKEAAFTATASTQDSSMVLSTSLNGTLTEHATLTSAGNLGIGVSDPDSKLEVLSTGTQAKFSYDADSFATIAVDSASAITIASGGSDAGGVILSSGAGGINLDTDGAITLDSPSNVNVLNATTSSASQGGRIRLTSNDGAAMASGHRLGVLEFAGAEDASSTITVGARIEALCDSGWSASENGTDLLFYTTDGNASQSEQMRILADGKVGIGVADPDAKLEILSTSTQAKFSYDSDSFATISVDSASVLTIATGGSDAEGIILDTDGAITLDSATGDVTFSDAGTAQLAVDMDGTAGEVAVQLKVDSDDLVFKQYDGTEVIRFTDAGSVEVKDNLSLKSDAAVLKFGASEEITLTHDTDKGLLLKHTATADDKPVSLTLQTGETDIAADNVIGKIDFQAPDEASDDADNNLVAAGIEAISEGDFSGTSNATKLSFKTAVSEAASEKMALSSAGNLSITGDLTVTGNDITFGNGATIVNTSADLLTITEAEVLLPTTTKLSFHDTGGGENIVASSDGHLEVNAGTTLDLSAPTVEINGTSNGTVQIDTGADGNFNVDSDTTTFSSSASQDPLVIIKNTTNNAGGSRLHFVKDNRNSQADDPPEAGGTDPGGGDDSDDLGVIEFIGDNDAAQQTSFAKIFAEISESKDGDEAGRLSLFVAESNGTSSQLTAGLVLEGEEGTDGEVDVTIAAGANSLTTIAGETLFTGITRMNSQSVDMGSGTSTTLTPTAPLVLLDADSIDEGSGFVHEVTITTSGYTTGDTVRFVITTDVNKNIAFVSGVLLASTKTFGIPSADAKGASFTLVYTGSAWAVLSTNGLPMIS